MGREISRTDARGVTYVTNYDYLGRVTSTTAFTPVSSEAITYTYGDANAGTGQMKLIGKALNTWTYSYEYDQYGRMTKEYLLSYETSYQYSDVGLVTRKTYPDGRALDYTYDAYGNHTGTNAVNGAVQWSRTGYTGTSATSSVTLGYTTPFTRTTQYDSNGCLQSQQLSRGGTTLMSNSYTFSSVTGNLTSRTMGAMTETFIYDDMDRLTEVLSGNQTQMHMDYTGNGNIEFKTGIGLYEYSSNTRPHAVTAVANTAGLIPDGTQTVDYNLWGKVSDVYATVGNDTYHYKIQYGPDLQRVFSELWKNNTEFLHFTFYDGGYEQRYADGQINYTYCIDGAGGTVALYTNHTQTGVKTYCLETDHLGSVTGLYDQNGNKAFSASYDVWGKRTVATGSIEYYRGFTGHEHLDQLGLIDMNGRMYDPLLGRFLSPDPFVQSPSDPQNYNRYSYCLNNPLKYIDPNGESVIAAIIISALVSSAVDYGMQVAVNYISGYSGKEAWFKKVDFFDIAVSGLFGGVTAGYGTAAKFGTKLGNFGKWVVNHGNAIRNSEIILTSAVDITGEGFQKVSGKQIVSRMAIGLATQAVTDAVISNSKNTKVENKSNKAAELSNQPNNLINDDGGHYSVYMGIDKNGDVKYIGITSREPSVRWNEHFRSNTSKSTLRFESIINSFDLSRTNARIWEQNLINQYGLENLYNKINSISPTYWNQFNIK